MRDNHIATSRGDARIQVLVMCQGCDEVVEICVHHEQYVAWMGGTLVQAAFPDVPREQREAFVSGTCPKCWKKTFGANCARTSFLAQVLNAGKKVFKSWTLTKNIGH